MLTHLVVENVALVDRLELEFGTGMTVISGETGAGKSIMLDALGLALGDRAETGLIADGAGKAEVHATFELAGNPAAIAWLEERELDADAGECILRRVVTNDGRSRAFVSGAPVTVADLKTLGDLLIDIHSQHEHQSLLKRDTQCRLLDEFGGLVSAARKVHRLCEEHEEARQALDKLLRSNEEQAARLQLLTYQAEELEALGASENEAGELEEEQKLLANAESVLRACDEALSICSEDESANALAQLSRAITLMSSIDLPQARPIAEMLESSRIQLEEAAHDIARFADSVELDPGRLAEVETRLSALYEVARKHRIEPGEIPDLQVRIGDEIATLGNVEEEIDKLEKVLDRLKSDYASAATDLGARRRKTAKQLEARVTDQLSQLGMQGATFDISIVPRDDGEPGRHGMEDIDFLISTNPGQAPRPLNRIASGGELSRISLAIEVVTADTSNVPTLVFDEVDVGIGGAVAEVVGSLLRRLGRNAQIICVTHLPQVAAQGHHHFQVTKTSDRKKATTLIRSLTGKEKVEEIARMLGGLEMTNQSLAHAEAMFNAAQHGENAGLN